MSFMETLMPITGSDVAGRVEERQRSRDTTMPAIKAVKHQGLCLCEEASVLSRETFIPCLCPAVALIDNGDRRLYWMCGACALHNIENRSARLVAFKAED